MENTYSQSNAQAAAATANDNDLPLTSNAVAALGYFCGLVAIAGLVLQQYQKDSYVRFHAVQALLFQASWFIAYIAFAIAMAIVTAMVSLVLGSLKMYALMGLLLSIPTTLSALFSLGMFVAWIAMIIMASQGKQFRVPYLAKMADRMMRR